jgi:UDP-2,3-diacylglucosamine hydrolase
LQIFAAIIILKNKIYFASDFHLGLPGIDDNHERERKIVMWLEEISEDAKELYLLGDIFDFWFEYKYTVPKGFVRLLGKLAEMSDKGTVITIFKGNHDMWMFGYLEKEIGAKIISDELIIERNGKKFFLHHGDGLGSGDSGYKFIRAVFRSPVCQWLFARIHPNTGIKLAIFLSGKSRMANMRSDLHYLGDEKEVLTRFAKEKLKTTHFDYFIFGHRHIPLSIDLGQGSKYINLGEWINHYTYAEFDGEILKLKTWKGDLIA